MMMDSCWEQATSSSIEVPATDEPLWMLQYEKMPESGLKGRSI